MDKAIIYILFIGLPTAIAVSALLPGKFYWRPRIELSKENNMIVRRVHQPIKKNIVSELVVFIDGYSLGMTIISLTIGYHAATKPFYHLHPRHASYHTNVYRWALRHLNLLQPWLAGADNNKYVDSQKAWRRRFYYMEEFVPKWLQRLAPWVDAWQWEEEEKFMKKYMKYAEPAFGKHYYYPTKTFNRYQSQITEETIENLDTA